jgi:hypothetical protein
MNITTWFVKKENNLLAGYIKSSLVESLFDLLVCIDGKGSLFHFPVPHVFLRDLSVQLFNNKAFNYGKEVYL